MTDDVDVDAMLEAPYKKDDTRYNDNRKSVKEKVKSEKYEKSIRSSEKDKDKRDSSSSRIRVVDDRRPPPPPVTTTRSRSRERRPEQRDRQSDRDRTRDREREREREREQREREQIEREQRLRERERERERLGRRSRSRSPRVNSRYRPPSPGYGGGGGGSRRPPTPPDMRGSSNSGGGSRRLPVPERRDLKLPGPERRDYMPFTPRYSPPKNVDVNAEMSPEERDARTVFCMQLARTIRPRDMEEFFSSVGRVRDVRIITDSKTRRSKGIAYIEFWDLESVPLALGLSGQRLLGAPIVCQPTQSEKNRMASAMLATTFGQNKGPMKLYIGSLHFNITEDMLRGIFEPFGKIDSIQLLKDPETNRSRGYGFVTFHNTEDAKRAMEQLNGFELAGRPMKVGHVTEHQPSAGGQSLDSDDLDRQGIDLGTTGRLQLMAKLAEGTGMQLPEVAQQMLNMQQQQQIQQQQQSTATPPIATQCFMLSNMFDPAQETEPNWDNDITEDVIEECNKHGGVLHIFVDKASPQGNVYVKCPTIAGAVAAVNSLHGRWFSGKIITANYVPVSSYHQLFPDAIHAATPLIASGSRQHGGGGGGL